MADLLFVLDWQLCQMLVLMHNVNHKKYKNIKNSRKGHIYNHWLAWPMYSCITQINHHNLHMKATKHAFLLVTWQSNQESWSIITLSSIQLTEISKWTYTQPSSKSSTIRIFGKSNWKKNKSHIHWIQVFPLQHLMRLAFSSTWQPAVLSRCHSSAGLQPLQQQDWHVPPWVQHVMYSHHACWTAHHVQPLGLAMHAWITWPSWNGPPWWKRMEHNPMDHRKCDLEAKQGVEIYPNVHIMIMMSIDAHKYTYIKQICIK